MIIARRTPRRKSPNVIKEKSTHETIEERNQSNDRVKTLNFNIEHVNIYVII